MRASEFRKNAAICGETRAAAEPNHKKSWLQLAGHWERLAHEAERYPGALSAGNGP